MLRTQTRSQELFAEAQQRMPGGVNSPVRAFRAVGGDPVYLRSGRGAMVTDVDGNEYLDYLGSWGPLILGHAHPRVIASVQDTAARGLSFGACNELEVEMARLLQELYPSMERVRMVSSGTEATMSALRVARGFTGRDVIVKFEGCYHGHCDYLLTKAGSGALTFDNPDSARGVPADLSRGTLTLPFNDLAAIEQLFEQRGRDLAAVIVEPVAGNMGVVPPAAGFLECLREWTVRSGALLILDEVMTGCRVARGGAQELYGIQPDLTTSGKIVGGGLPVGAYGGRRDIMERIAPLGPVYQAGTLSGNPVSLAAGLETLRILGEDADVYRRLDALSATLADGLTRTAARAGVPLIVQRVGSMMTPFFTTTAVTDMTSARQARADLYGRFFRSMLLHGTYLPPSQFEALFVSAAHTEADVQATLGAAKTSMEAMVKEGLASFRTAATRPRTKPHHMPIAVFKSIEHELELVDRHFLSSANQDVALVFESAQSIIRSGGKRVRPALVLLAAQIFDSLSDTAIRIATSVEMIHVASLLHDDVVDNAKQRRGITSVSVDFSNKVSVLLADFLLTQSLLELCQDETVAYTRIVSQATARMALGQLKEIQEQNNLGITLESYLAIIDGKTAALMSACSRLGALIGGAAPADIENLAAYGHNLGMGFQIVDDCLDFWGDERELGKPVGNDLLEKKFTLPFIHALQHGSAEQVERMTRYVSNGGLQDGQFREIRSIMDTLGSRDHAMQLARQYCDAARATLQRYDRTRARSALEDLVDYVIERHS